MCWTRVRLRSLLVKSCIINNACISCCAAITITTAARTLALGSHTSQWWSTQLVTRTGERRMWMKRAPGGWERSKHQLRQRQALSSTPLTWTSSTQPLPKVLHNTNTSTHITRLVVQIQHKYTVWWLVRNCSIESETRSVFFDELLTRFHTLRLLCRRL